MSRAEINRIEENILLLNMVQKETSKKYKNIDVEYLEKLFDSLDKNRHDTTTGREFVKALKERNEALKTPFRSMLKMLFCKK